MQRWVGWAVLWVGLWLPLPSFAASWEASFPADVMQALFATADQKVMVVAAGDKASGAEPAAAAFEASLRKGGRVALVMNDDAIGNVEQLDDEAVVKKCQAMPVTQIAVVRVFPGADKAPATAVITLYDKKAQVTRALTAQEGSPLTLEAAGAPSEGVSAAAANAVGDITRVQTKDMKKAMAEYQERALWFEDWVTVDQNGAQHGSGSSLYMGKYKKVISGAEFWRLVGREDLALAEERNGWLLWITAMPGGLLASFGAVGVLVGGIMAGIGFMGSQGMSGSMFRNGMFATGASAGAMVLGAGFLVPWYLLQPEWPKQEDTRRMADQYNQKLKAELGLTDADFTP